MLTFLLIFGSLLLLGHCVPGSLESIVRLLGQVTGLVR